MVLPMLDECRLVEQKKWGKKTNWSFGEFVFRSTVACVCWTCLCDCVFWTLPMPDESQLVKQEKIVENRTILDELVV
jgi:hypothetical protein